MRKLEEVYEGKAKKVFKTDDPDLFIVDYKDDATAFNGLKKGSIAGKGVINNQMSNFLMQMLEKNGVPTHFVRELSERDTLVKKVKIVPLGRLSDTVIVPPWAVTMDSQIARPSPIPRLASGPFPFVV